MRKWIDSCLCMSMIFVASCSSSDSPIADSAFSTGVSHLESISNKYVTASLATDGLLSSNDESLQKTSDFCSFASDDLVECQPALLRRYYVASSKKLTSMIDAAKKIGAAAGDLSISTSAKTVTLSGVEGFDQISYIKSKSSLSLIALKASEPLFYLSVTGSKNKDLTLRMKNSSTGEILQAETSFESNSAWSATVFQVNAPCDNADVRKPERTKIRVSLANDLLKGKAMVYLPRWNFGQSSPATCTTSDPSVNAETIYLDFVANSKASKGNAFFFSYQQPSNFQEGSYQAAFGIPGACENGGVVCASTRPKNSFCNLPNTLQVSFDNDTCSASSTEVSDAAFGSFDDWDAPAQFYLQSVTIPSSDKL